MRRFFVKTNLGKDFDLIGQEYNHLSNVLRIKSGERVIVLCGDEYDYNYEVGKITKNSAHLRFIDQEINKRNPKFALTVYMALVKSDKLHAMITQLNEIGVTELVLFSSEFSNISPKSVNLSRLNAMAEQSCKQCGRSIPMHVRYTADPLSFELMDTPLVLFADETLCGEAREITGNPTAIIIGPEGGFSPDEHDMLCSMSNILPISMGSRILRAETAATVLSSILLHNSGEI